MEEFGKSRNFFDLYLLTYPVPGPNLRMTRPIRIEQVGRISPNQASEYLHMGSHGSKIWGRESSLSGSWSENISRGDALWNREGKGASLEHYQVHASSGNWSLILGDSGRQVELTLSLPTTSNFLGISPSASTNHWLRTAPSGCWFLCTSSP